MIIEAYGGIAPHSRAALRRLARRASAKGARDRTVYGTTRISTRSFYTHHAQRIVKAVVHYDALNIIEQIDWLPQGTWRSVRVASTPATARSMGALVRALARSTSTTRSGSLWRRRAATCTGSSTLSGAASNAPSRVTPTRRRRPKGPASLHAAPRASRGPPHLGSHG